MTPERWLPTVDAASFRRRLLRWYDRHGRDFAWRRSTDLYAVWVSEVMLQQTTTATVSKRFPKFLDQFPNIAALAQAPEDVVLRAWEGLGYYRRARNLHRAARSIMETHGGGIPENPAVLQSLPGLGRYSANAILSFARNLPLPILEANTIRVWSRLVGARGDATRQPLIGGLWQVAEALLPLRRPRDFNLALMDLGAMICTPRSPACANCPLRSECRAFRTGRPERFPMKASRPAVETENWVVAVIRRGEQYLVGQRSETGRWAGMWEFPNARLANGEDAEAAAGSLAESAMGVRGRPTRLPTVRHGIMHYRLELSCFLFEAQKRNRRLTTFGVWTPIEKLADLPMSKAHRRIVTFLTDAPVGESVRSSEPI
jgi:A/G-specific adenine glycosylase